MPQGASNQQNIISIKLSY